MEIIYISLAVIAVLLGWNIYLTSKAGKKEESNELTEIKNSVASLIQNLKDTEANLKSEFATNRKESSDSATGLRTEVVNQLNKFTQTFSEQLTSLTNSIGEKFTAFQTTIDSNNKESRKELKENLDSFKNDLQLGLKDFKDHLRNNFSDFQNQYKTQSEAQNLKIGELKTALENSVNKMQEGNEKKLEEMRKTVDEKLNETLEKRLGESFKLVSERLEAVHKGLGDMQNLAKDVGNLNKTMNNVKSRGILGEYQLHNLLEDLLTNEQYEQNVKTKVGSGAVVEFAVKMPHGNNIEKTLWLPIDSKFPKEDYEALVDAYDKGEVDKIEGLRKAFAKSIRKNAQDIKEKYIDPPNTTEYGVMFLPYESLYAEVLRTPGLFEQLQKDFKITIAGPTTLSAFLNSLQMGFRTLAIEKRSSEVWDLLGAVKTEFKNFGDVLVKTKKKLDEASNVIDTAGVRSRAIERKLRDVQELPQEKSKLILEANNEEPQEEPEQE